MRTTLSVALAAALILLIVDSAIELSFVSTMVGWLQRLGDVWRTYSLRKELEGTDLQVILELGAC
jgi:hypothetical protein